MRVQTAEARASRGGCPGNQTVRSRRSPRSTAPVTFLLQLRPGSSLRTSHMSDHMSAQVAMALNFTGPLSPFHR